MASRIQPADLGFFSTLAMAGSLSAAAREMRITTAAVSRRLSQMEARLGVPLVNRTTRRMGLTVEGETLLRHARSILAEMAELEQQLGASQASPSGLLRVNATLGFGRSHVGPLIGHFVEQHPQVDVQLQLSVDPPALTDDAFDVCIRFGPPPDARVIARKLADNRRLLCAAPSYLARHGTPKTPADLTRHNFISTQSLLTKFPRSRKCNHVCVNQVPCGAGKKLGGETFNTVCCNGSGNPKPLQQLHQPITYRPA